jgi:hypothetical protein
MTDWTTGTGNGGSLMIRDTGSMVYLYVKAGSTQTWINGATASWYLNGTSSGSFDYPTGADWYLVKSGNVSTNQTVRLTLNATGTSGLGGPTTITHAINRDTVPPPPVPVTFSSITQTSVYTTFSGNGDGGATIIKWQLASHNVNTTSGASIFTSDGTLSVTGLVPGTVYYFWARGQNAVGYGAWSSVRSMKTLKLPAAPSQVTLSSISQTSMIAKFSGNDMGVYTTWSRWELARNTANTTTGATIITASGTSTVTGLLPGTTYYWWARGISSTGTGPWSVVKSARTIAGARVLVNGVWKEAIPYVNVAGVWKLAQPWSRAAGVWKQTG